MGVPPDNPSDLIMGGVSCADITVCRYNRNCTNVRYCPRYHSILVLSFSRDVGLMGPWIQDLRWLQAGILEPFVERPAAVTSRHCIVHHARSLVGKRRRPLLLAVHTIEQATQLMSTGSLHYFVGL